MKGAPEAAMAAALNGRSFGTANGTASVHKAASAAHKNAAGAHAPAPTRLGPGDIHLGDVDGDPAQKLGLSLAKLMEGRMLIQGISGAGKSWTLRRLIEQTWSRVQQIVIDPEGEFRELADKLELLHVEGHRLDIATLETIAQRAREHRASLVLDLSELDRDEQMQSATAFFSALIAAPRAHWHPVLVAVDEAHLFAPFGGFSEATHTRKAAISAVSDLMGRGRKRGIAGVLATQRIAKLAKSAASEVHNFMIGLNTLDLDIRRAAETIGWDARKGFDRLPMLEPGDFVVVGPGFTRSPAVLRVGQVETPHRGAAPALDVPTALAPKTARRLLDLDALTAASARDRSELEERAAAPGLRHVRAFLREDAFPDAGRVWGALRKLEPDGARVKDLATHLNRSIEDVAAGLELLDRFGAVEFDGEDDKRAARIAKGMRS